MLNNIIKGFRVYIECMKNMVKYDESLLHLNGYDINMKGYICKQNTRLVTKRKSLLAFCSKFTFTNGYYVPIIITDGYFRLLSEDTQRFAIQHELGHYNLQPEIFEDETKRNDTLEFEADEYAMNIVGKEIAIKGLEEIKELLITIHFGKDNKECIKELDRRIYNLMNKESN